jgi:hypothetical protein
MSKTETPGGVIELWRRDTQVQQHTLQSAGRNALAQSAKIDRKELKSRILLNQLLGR